MNENIPCRSAKSRRASFGRHLCVSVCVCASVQHYMCKQCKEKELMSCVCVSVLTGISGVCHLCQVDIHDDSLLLKDHLSMCVWVCVSSPWSVTLTWNYMAVSLRVSVWIQCPSDNDRHSIFLSVFCSETLTCWAFCASVFKLLLLLKLHIQISSWGINEEQEREFTRVNCT